MSTISNEAYTMGWRTNKINWPNDFLNHLPGGRPTVVGWGGEVPKVGEMELSPEKEEKHTVVKKFSPFH